MVQTRGQNDENEDPQTELGVEDQGAPTKKKRGGNRATSKRAKKRSNTAGNEHDRRNVITTNPEGEESGSITSSPTKSVLEELERHSPNGDGNIDDDDDDDDSVELTGNNVGPPSRHYPFVGSERGGRAGNANVAHRNGVDDGWPPSRDNPFVGSERGGRAGNANVAHRNGIDNGGPPSRDNPFVGGERGGRAENASVVHGNGVGNGGPPSRDYPFGGDRRGLGNGNFDDNGGAHSRDNPFVGGPRGTGNGNSHPFGGMQVNGGQQLGHGNGYPFGGADDVGGQLYQRTNDELRGGGAVEEYERRSLQQERRAMSYRTAKGLTKKNIRERIQVTVKTVIFRGVKFITCKEYFEKVMQVILGQEKPDNPQQFARMYKTIVMGALNTKRSTCEQSAQEAAMKLLKNKNHVDEVDPPPYSMDTLCKLRQSRTVEEKEAFLWFAGELLECVCGKRAWGTRKKYRATISDATANDTGKFIVTVSDEAFALLLYDAYINKWIKRYHEDRRGEPRSKRIVGKYTQTDGASTEYGGWSEEGIHRFNLLCEMVQEDRNSRNAREAEDWLMDSLRQQAGGGAQMGTEREIDQAALQRSLERTNQPIVNAFIEL